MDSDDGDDDEDEEDQSIAAQLDRAHSNEELNRMTSLAYLSMTRTSFSGNRSTMLNDGNARKPAMGDAKYRGIGDALLAKREVGSQVLLQPALASVQLAVRPGTGLGDRFEAIGCEKVVLRTGESVRIEQGEEEESGSSERAEGTEEWVMAPINPLLLAAAANLLVGDCSAAKEVMSKASESDKCLTVEALRSTRDDLAAFAEKGSRGHVDYSLNNEKNDWIRDKEKWLSREEIRAIDEKHAVDNLTVKEVDSLTLAMVLTKVRYRMVKIFNGLVCDLYGEEVDDDLCTAKFMVSGC